MAHNLTEGGTYAANVTVPDPGDPRTAASVELPFQQLADRTNNHQTRLTAAETNITAIKAVSPGAATSLVLKVPLMPVWGSNQDWRHIIEGQLNDADDDGSVAYFDLSSVLPRGGGKIHTISMTLLGTSGHGALPGNMPKLELLRKDGVTGAVSVRATLTDSSASTAAYQAIHGLQQALGSPESISGFGWWYKLTGESGSNALTELGLIDLSIIVVP